MSRWLTRGSVVALLALATPSRAVAQGSLAPPPQIPYGLAISTERAKSTAAVAIAEAHRQGLTMAIAIVDPGGHLVYFEKMQDTQTGSVDVAVEKARTSALFRRPTKLFQDALATGGEALRILRINGVIPVDGGMPIIVDGKVVGAIGVSGGSGDQDGRVATAGAASVK